MILVMDSFGVGATEDAHKFGDEGSNTLLHIAEQCAAGNAEEGRTGPLTLPNLSRLGLGIACKESGGIFPPGLEQTASIIGAHGFAEEISTGKDTPSGHWELAGVPVTFEWGYFKQPTNSFPPELVEEFCKRAGVDGILGNCHASGTEILERLGEEHLATQLPICYTSADSVFQIAVHEEVFGLGRLYEICNIARDLCDEYNIGRVIARPFLGTAAHNFERTGNRRDYSVLPPAPTLLDKLLADGGQVFSVGKIGDIFAHQGISQYYKANGNDALFDSTLQALNDAGDRTLIFSNFVDFDMLYGHRRNVAGYAAALEHFDQRLPELLAQLGDEDIVILTADHGCDPTWEGTDHTREHVPVLAFGQSIPPENLGLRTSFADVGQSLTSFFGLTPMAYGKSFIHSER
nr:phosphopentomutase [Echinimonas agarilytica]